ncbi:ABC-F family ATP-binding cassette domain-containing protein [Mycolicibacterium poriferae]|uniref:ABC transporter ATP-binding protein n=1 Tax=Mycolicibacterium poriferae TaxID=39694 RepID=A0A6N4VFZ4_9MYCO|nr:ABC-F family ATP-binding cassette domain-containing protein [Mycolicibacterium poriferae]MCV7264823.1 ABC-F family ATP-binding cassette domain-containing protein [Mycolicibacterium poriferae]BBX53551.1 ABC transporter ATP-binding protein [Mycolicibacterium poriferae]
MSSLTLSDVSLRWDDGTPLFTELSFTPGPGRTGLVARNGAGKSALLRLIAGELTPSSGSIVVDGTVGYLPQTLPMLDDRSVAELLGVATVIDALEALAGGDAGEWVFTAIGEDWDVEERARAQLDRLGLAGVSLDRSLRSLSGGEVVSLGLARELLRRPDILLLDEPTNNLDTAARERLDAALDDYTGLLVVVSHDRALLDRMDRIAELRDGRITTYGGNFSCYLATVDEAQRAATDAVRNAEQQLKREKRQRQQARERADRKAGNAKRTLSDAGLPKIVAGAMKRRAQETAGRGDGVHARRIDDARNQLDDAERALRDDDILVLDLPDTTVPGGRTLVHASDVRVSRGGRAVLDGVELTVRGPERIALTGPNGAGKTTLLRVLTGEIEPEDGRVHVAAGRVAYLSQRLDLLDDDRSVAENLAAAAPSLPLTRRRHLLAQFLFRGDTVDTATGSLSGGERLRATLACVLFAEPAPQLLLLDEPTNNLDLAGVAQLESALAAYRGAFIVVSHDAVFLDRIGVERRVRLDGGRLREPSDDQDDGDTRDYEDDQADQDDQDDQADGTR